MIASGGPQPEARSISAPEPGSLRLLLRHLETFVSPDRIHAIFAHVPPLLPQEIRDRTIPIPPVFLRERNHARREPTLNRLRSPDRAVRRSDLSNRPTRPALGDVEHGDGMPHGLALAGRA